MIRIPLKAFYMAILRGENISHSEYPSCHKDHGRPRGEIKEIRNYQAGNAGPDSRTGGDEKK
jgi:hypothetical protein